MCFPLEKRLAAASLLRAAFADMPSEYGDGIRLIDEPYAFGFYAARKLGDYLMHGTLSKATQPDWYGVPCFLPPCTLSKILISHHSAPVGAPVVVSSLSFTEVFASEAEIELAMYRVELNFSKFAEN